MRLFLAACILSASTAFRSAAIAIDPVVATDSVYAAGLHDISNDVRILPGAALSFLPGATVQFAQVSGSFVVEGSLNAQGMTVIGVPLTPYWGWLWAQPGSTVMLDRCVLLGGGSHPFLPIGAGSNHVVTAHDAVVCLSNTVFSSPARKCLYATGSSSVHLFSNEFPYVARGTATIEFSPDKTMAVSGGGNLFSSGAVRNVSMDGIVLAGTIGTPTVLDMLPDGHYAVNLIDDAGATPGLRIANAPLSLGPGTVIRLSQDYGIVVEAGGSLEARGTASNRVSFLNDLNRDQTNETLLLPSWRSIEFRPGSTGILSGVTLRGAGCLLGLTASYHSILVDGAFLVMSNSIVRPGAVFALDATNAAEVHLENVDLQYFNVCGFNASTGSRAVMRNCSIININRPYGYGIHTDGSCSVDARFCWWDSATGPSPYGSGQEVFTNGNDLVVFPWLLAPPYSAGNPPVVAFISPTNNFTTPDPTIMVSGYAFGSNPIVRVSVVNPRTTIPFWSEFIPPSNWQASVLLYSGINPITVYAWDSASNVAIDSITVSSTGGIDGGSNAPMIDPVPSRVVQRGSFVRFKVVAASTEREQLFYWAERLPEGAQFSPFTRDFFWSPALTGCFKGITFLVTDGIHVVSNMTTITVITSSPPCTIAVEQLPCAYANEPYYYVLAADNAVGQVTWSYPATAIFPIGMGMARAGVIAGVYGSGSSFGQPLLITANDSRGPAFAASKSMLLMAKGTPPTTLRTFTPFVPFYASGDVVGISLEATNIAGHALWDDATDVLRYNGLNIIEGTPTVTGTVFAGSSVPWTALVRDDSNISAFANYTVPVVPRECLASFVTNGTLLKITAAYKPGKTGTGSIKAKTKIALPPEFHIATNNPCVASAFIGYYVIDGRILIKGKPEKKLLFEQQSGPVSFKIQVAKGKTYVQAIFLMKNIDFGQLYAPFGIRNASETTYGYIPCWFRIGDYVTPMKTVRMTIKSKLGKASIGSAKW